MDFAASLLRIVDHLDTVGIPYMVCGSVASGFYGEPRTTHDVDLIIDPTASQIRLLLARLGVAYYASESAAAEALANKSMFNVIDLEEGAKFDFIILDNRPFSVEEFRRRVSQPLRDRMIAVLTAEDSILSKLVWNQMCESERQIRDVKQIILLQNDRLDREYLQTWAKQLGVDQQLDALFD